MTEYRRNNKVVTKMEHIKMVFYVSHQAELDIGLYDSSEDLTVQLWN